jgi:oligopeptidase B
MLWCQVPYKHGSFLYYTRTVKGLSYKLHCRKSSGDAESSAEVIILDENELAKEKDYCDVGMCEPSPSHKLLAYAVDYVGT